MTEMTYRIKFRKGDFELELQGDQKWVEQKFKELTGEESILTIPAKVMEEGMPETLGEFLDMKGDPKKHTEIVAVFAYWLFKVENMESFNVKDIIACYEKVRKSKPTNANQIINTDVASHLFAEAREKKDGLKAWILSRTGEEFVENMT